MKIRRFFLFHDFSYEKESYTGNDIQEIISVTITDVFYFKEEETMKKLAMKEALRKKLTKAGHLHLRQWLQWAEALLIIITESGTGADYLRRYRWKY